MPCHFDADHSGPFVVPPGQVVEVRGPVLLLPPLGVRLEEIPSVGQRQGCQPNGESGIRVFLQSVQILLDGPGLENPLP